MSNTTTQSVLFPDQFPKPGLAVFAAFDQAHSSTDGGGLLLKAIDERLGLSAKLASCLRDARESGKVRHEIEELFRQRMFAIALGYPDCNDARVLADDPIHMMLVGRTPLTGDSLASQSTLSRFENGVGRCELYRMIEALADIVIDRHQKRLGRNAKRIVLDFDPTDDPTHGQQEFSFYRGHYGHHCFLPMVGTIQFNRESKQSVLCTVLRPGNADASLGFVPILDRLLAKIRVAFPKTRIRVRLDAGFGSPSVLDYLDAAGVEYVVGLSNWSLLKKVAAKAQRLALREPRENLRFLVTNFKMSPHGTHGFYSQRGDAENRIKELKQGLERGRTSCSSFRANQLRVQLTTAAYVLMQELSRQARHTAYRDAQVTRLRERLLKLPVWVEESVRRVVLHLPAIFLAKDDWHRIALAVGGHSP